MIEFPTTRRRRLVVMNDATNIWDGKGITPPPPTSPGAPMFSEKWPNRTSKNHQIDLVMDGDEQMEGEGGRMEGIDEDGWHGMDWELTYSTKS
uniref:Uncharacterized protein n=1 Tax=Globodera rostochiensis TaxID=31243 RepID=A0A914HLI6_GLORO